MRSITSLPNTEAPDADFPGGRLKNTVGLNPGTRVNESMTGDWAQFFYKLMVESGSTANELPDNEYSGYQLFEALLSAVPKKFVKQLLVDGDGQVVTITRTEMQNAVGSGINAFSNGLMLAGTSVNQFTDVKVVVYVLGLSAVGKWDEVDVNATGNKVRVVNSNGNIEITLGSFVVTQLPARIVIIG